MGTIKKLDVSVINKIAAGEIIVQPANALKEMLENSIDANATVIDVVVKDGGLKLLQITDNGSGINKDDMGLLCERFATSKLAKFEDLESINTYGFRGEALASISHISRVSVITKTKDSPLAFKAFYTGGKMVGPNFKTSAGMDPKPIAGKDGTQIVVEDLFYNLPSRVKSLKSKSEEYSRIVDVIGRYAVHSAGVGIACKKFGDAHQVIATRPGLPLKERIRTVFGTAVAGELLELEIPANEDFGLLKASGAISSPNYDNKKKLPPVFFINHRLVSCDPLKRALNSAYQVFLAKGSHPFIYLSLEIDPKNLDVNVHPTKREVRFLHEEEIIDHISAAVHTELSKVDTSRKFKTQSLLGIGEKRRFDASELSTGLKKPREEHKLVRVDPHQYKISSYLSHQSKGKYMSQVSKELRNETSSTSDEVDSQDRPTSISSATEVTFVDLDQAEEEEKEKEEKEKEKEKPDRKEKEEKEEVADKEIEDTSRVEVSPHSHENREGAGAKRGAPKVIEDVGIEAVDTSVAKSMKESPRDRAREAKEADSSLASDREVSAESASEDDSDVEEKFTLTGRPRVTVNLESIKELRNEFAEQAHRPLAKVFNNAAYVGIVDEKRRLCCFQYDVNLYLCDYSATLLEFYYQIALEEFCNYGTIELKTPVLLEDLMRPLQSMDVQPTSVVCEKLEAMSEMLQEYFQITIARDDEGLKLHTLPLILKHVRPPLSKLPYFIYRLAIRVNYDEEKACLHDIMHQIALLYLPEPVECEEPSSESADTPQRARLEHTLEHVLFPLIKRRFVPTKALENDVIQIADLPGLYKVFERC